MNKNSQVTCWQVLTMISAERCIQNEALLVLSCVVTVRFVSRFSVAPSSPSSSITRGTNVKKYEQETIFRQNLRIGIKCKPCTHKISAGSVNRTDTENRLYDRKPKKTKTDYWHP